MHILLDLFLTFAKVGAFTFGGGYAMIALLDNECVEKKKWITPDEMAEMTVVAESTPGPISINCATYTGYKQAGILGAIVATIGMVLPSFLIILLISSFVGQLLDYPIVANAFRGVRVAVAILIIRAGIKMVQKLLKAPLHKVQSIIFVIAFFLIMFIANCINIHLSTIWLMMIAGVCGVCLAKVMKREEGK